MDKQTGLFLIINGNQFENPSKSDIADAIEQLFTTANFEIVFTRKWSKEQLKLRSDSNQNLSFIFTSKPPVIHHYGEFIESSQKQILTFALYFTYGRSKRDFQNVKWNKQIVFDKDHFLVQQISRISLIALACLLILFWALDFDFSLPINLWTFSIFLIGSQSDIYFEWHHLSVHYKVTSIVLLSIGILLFIVTSIQLFF